MGLIKKTGIEINIPYEAGGRIPNPEEKKETIKALTANFLDENFERYLISNDKINPKKEVRLLMK